MPHRIAARLRGAAHTQIARADLARSLGTLVDTLAQARALAAGGSHGTDLAMLIARARHELDVADEKLLVLDRRRQRSYFRSAARIRFRIARLERSLAASSP